MLDQFSSWGLNSCFFEILPAFFFSCFFRKLGFERSSVMAWSTLGILQQHNATTTVTVTLITLFTISCVSNLGGGSQEIEVQHLDEDGSSTAESRQDAAAASRSVGRLASVVSSIGLATASIEAIDHQSGLSKENLNMSWLKCTLWVGWSSCVLVHFGI